MGRLIYGVDYILSKLNCKVSYERCNPLIGARCVIYKGIDYPSFPITAGDDLDTILNEYDFKIWHIGKEIDDIIDDWGKTSKKVQDDIQNITKDYNELNKWLDNLEKELCTKIENCPEIVDMIKRLDTINDTFCEKIEDCHFEVDEKAEWFPTGLTVCSFIDTKYEPSEDKSKNIYSFREERDRNINSPTYKQYRYIRTPKNDGICKS